MAGAGGKVDWLAFLFHEQTIVRAKPRTVLRIGARVVREPAQPDITADRGQITSLRVDDIENFL
jgi:hypothetical protein